MSSAICFNSYQSKILSSGNGLTLYHTILTFTTLKQKAFENIVVGKAENSGNQHFLFFPQCFISSHMKFDFLSHVYFVVCKCL